MIIFVAAGVSKSSCWNEKFLLLEQKVPAGTFLSHAPLGLITTTIPIKFPRATPSVKPVARCQPKHHGPFSNCARKLRHLVNLGKV